MKRTIVLFGVAFIAVIALAVSAYAVTTEEELEGLLGRIELLVATLNQQGYTIVHIEVDKLEKGQSYIASREFFTANDYVIAGIGGIGIGDLDVQLYDGKDNLIDEDNSDDNLPVVEVSPKFNGKYKVKVTPYSLEADADPEGEYFFCYIIGFKRSE